MNEENRLAWERLDKSRKEQQQNRPSNLTPQDAAYIDLTSELAAALMAIRQIEKVTCNPKEVDAILARFHQFYV